MNWTPCGMSLVCFIRRMQVQTYFGTSYTNAACGRRVTKLYGAAGDLERDVSERGHVAEPDRGPLTVGRTEA